MKCKESDRAERMRVKQSGRKGFDWSWSLNKSGVSIPDVFRDIASNWALLFTLARGFLRTEQLAVNGQVMLTGTL